MLQTLMFFSYIGSIALIFCKVEGTSYVDALYFEVVTTLTIGFGDVVPQTTAFKVLTFPFTIVGIALLALNVTSIVRLLADRSRRRKISMKRELKNRERKRIKEQKDSEQGAEQWTKEPSHIKGPRGATTLQEALRKIREDSWQHEKSHNLRAMFTGLFVFISFWFLGAMIFNFVEVLCPLFDS
jgi:potassium channel subfamily K, other eukaryote